MHKDYNMFSRSNFLLVFKFYLLIDLLFLDNLLIGMVKLD